MLSVGYQVVLTANDLASENLQLVSAYLPCASPRLTICHTLSHKNSETVRHRDGVISARVQFRLAVDLEGLPAAAFLSVTNRTSCPGFLVFLSPTRCKLLSSSCFLFSSAKYGDERNLGRRVTGRASLPLATFWEVRPVIP